MSKKRYVVELSADDRKRLEELTRKGKSPAKKQLKAQADESPLGPKWNDPKISEALGTYPMMCTMFDSNLRRVVDSDAKCNTLGRSGSPRKDRIFSSSPPPSAAFRRREGGSEERKIE